MKSNQIYIVAILLTGTVFLTSCDKDLLNVAPPDKLSTTIFWKSPSDADLALTGLYNFLGAGAPGGLGQYQPYIWDDFSDNSHSFSDRGGALSMLYSGLTPTTQGFMSIYYPQNYKAIAAINSFLANVGKVLEGEKLKMYKGQAFFLRAFNYFWLAKLYGNVPIVKDDPFTISPKAHLATSKRTDVLAFIESDLDSAIAYLPDVSPYDGHAVKGTAEGYMVRVLLFENKYAQAAVIAKQIIDSKKFSLNPCYSCNFYKPNQNSSKEIMFSVQFLPPIIIHPNGASDMLTLGSFSSYSQGTQDLVDSYESIDGKSIGTSSLYDPQNPYENRDPRMRMTLFFPGDIKAQGWPSDNNPAIPGKGGWREGYFRVKKWLTPGVSADAGYANQPTDANDWVLLRYADILLMYAEAQNEAVGPDASVYNAVNLVRERAGMPDLLTGLMQDQMRDAIRYERRAEFALEGIRFFDLRRWGIAEQVMNGFVPNALFPNIKAVYEPKFEYWPIPQYEIDFNAPEMKQNPGY